MRLGSPPICTSSGRGTASKAPCARHLTPLRWGSATAVVGIPSVGLGALSFFDLLRVDVARGLRDGRWTFSIDLSRDFWSIL